MKYLILVCFGFLIALPTLGQEVLRYEQFLDWVKYYHPIAKQADINKQFGEQEMRIARGGFDPLLYGNYDNKQFSDTEYYDKREGGIVIPTMAGVELKGVFEQNSGTYLNPERTVPNNGLIAAGASVNLGQGLFIDKRRAALRQAEIYLNVTQTERQQILNDLYVDASEAYWFWSSTYQNMKILEESVELAEVRFEAVKTSFIQGDLPAIDTIEAYTQVMNRMYRFQSAQIDYFKAAQNLETFLWDEDDNPMNIAMTTFPQNVLDDITLDYDQATLRSLIAEHPLLRLTDYELASLEVERRWKAEQLKPVVKVNYNFLTETVGQFNESPFFENNYKWGFTIQTPLLLRKERGGLGLTKAKIDFKQNDRDLKFLQLRTKLEAEINKFQTLQQQLAVYNANILGLERLLEGEQTRFNIGESSLFLINAREVSVLDGRLILNDLAAKRKVAYVQMLNAAGLGFDE
ncbi:outer membrane protein [Belliella baltica DSM 15883]|uniref:Outer membrane protein n=1 Tax=Belliella baltica (strain DSM 15883 / CIP 108006 / LMG 21964 / BA134) TaxID=866536 RepID=I3Z7F1_BELBD|nr:TolC family protein [Belliella baltica]AFL85169.1 outer membrane protein [Belliella baltica DSM 15883]